MRSTHTLVVFALSNVIAAQCGMTVTNVTQTPLANCDAFVGMTMGVTGVLSGGTPPYSVRFEVLSNGMPVAAETVPYSGGGGCTRAVVYGCPNNCNDWNTGLLYPHIRVTDSQGCVAENYGPSNYYYFDRLSHVPGALATNTWTVQVEPINCAGGTFRMRLVDNPQEAGSSVAGTGLNYALVKNGSTLESGALASKFVQAFNSLVFEGLAPGIHFLNISVNVSAVTNVAYCPTQCTVRFVVPNAGDCGVNLSIQASLGTTSDALRAAGLLPATEPYSALGYTYVGSAPGATAGAGVFNITGTDAIVDWVVVELRTAIQPTQVVCSVPALLQVDGDVVGLNGAPYVTLPTASGNYHVVIRHRNRLALASGVPHACGLFTGIDLRDMSVSTWSGDHSLPQGDTNGDGMIKYTGSANDRDPILLAVGSTTPNATLTNVYDRRDTNLDGVIKYTGTANDRDIILTNVGSTTPNNTRTQQLP